MLTICLQDITLQNGHFNSNPCYKGMICLITLMAQIFVLLNILFLFVENEVIKKFTTACCEWIKTNKALLSLLIALLENKAIEYLTGSKIAH